MDKKDVARILEEIGTFLEIKGENPFKIRAYANAARALEAASADLKTLAREKRLTEIPGIGQGIAEKIAELLQKGRLSYYETLKKEIPSGVLEMLDIPSVGPKRAKLLYDKLGIKTLGELEVACKENRLLDLEGFGEKSQEKILEGLRHRERHKEYHLYDQAFEAAQEILEHLHSFKKIQRASIAGSLRRRKEIIRDIDFLVSSKDPAAVMDHFGAPHEVRVPAGLSDSVAEVYVLRVHEVLGTEPLDALEDMPLDHQAGPGNDVHGRRRGRILEQRLHPPDRQTGEAGLQVVRVQELVDQGRKGPDTLHLNRQIRVQQLGSNDAHVRALVGERHHRWQRRSDDLRVRVQKEQVPAG